MNVPQLIQEVTDGFHDLKVEDKYKSSAVSFIQQWLTEPQFVDYLPQLTHLISSKHWNFLLDSFYQVIPFGTGGRRGEVGIGPNRINPWTIQASAQGHAQYLLKLHGDAAKTRGVVLAYDVRQFYTNKFFNDELPNPVRNMKSIDLAQAAAKVYTANGIKIYLFDEIRTTPELSFAIRYLHAVAGDMFSASHNPPEHNGKKVYDEFGGQLIPPLDEQLVDEVTKNVAQILTLSDEAMKASGLIQMIGKEVDDAYVETCTKLSLSTEREIGIVYTPLHGCGASSVDKVLQKLGFTVLTDPETSNPSGKFEHVTFNIPNPEVTQSFETTLIYARKMNADIILNSDPDADRIGVMVNHHGEWKFINGNDIGAILTQYVIQKKKDHLKGQGIVLKTEVTTNLITRIAELQGMRVVGNLLVGFKYIADEMNKMEKEGVIDNFLLAAEESHGYISGNYVRDKDAVVPAIWLSELAAELKKQDKTLLDYLEEIYMASGYFRNYLTEIRILGANGMSEISKIQENLRTSPPSKFGDFSVIRKEDWLERLPLVSETDRAAKNGMVLHIQPVEKASSIRITIRPSGTEPKIKMYFELGTERSNSQEELDVLKSEIETLVSRVEKAFMTYCYKILGVDFPERGFLLFWQLPLHDKLHYFEIEDELATLKDEADNTKKQDRLNALFAFLGSDPIKKVDAAFKAKYSVGIQEYIGLK